MRYLLALLVVAVSAAPATADVLLIKKGKKIVVVGLKSTIGGIAVGPGNWRAFADKSTGLVERDGYDAVWFSKTGRSKPVEYSLDQVVVVHYTTEPLDLLDGYDAKSVGDWRRALSFFRRCAADQAVRPVYRAEARYLVGICAYQLGSPKAAASHFAKWDLANSKYTPMVYGFVAAILTSQKKYDQARLWYAKIATLEGIPKAWVFQSKLGDVKVDIQERKYASAEGKARALAREIGSVKSLSDSLGLAYALQGQAIIAGGKPERLPEAERVLRGAAELTHVSDGTMAQVYTALGDALYAQGKPELARFPYMRVVTLYPDQADFVANGLLNAGQCFLDMSGRTRDDQARADALMVQGMKLLAECAGRYKKKSAGRKARVVYRKRKTDFEAAKKRIGS